MIILPVVIAAISAISSPLQDRSPAAAQTFIREVALAGGLSGTWDQETNLQAIVSAERGSQSTTQPTEAILAAANVCETTFVFERSRHAFNFFRVRWGGAGEIVVSDSDIRLTGSETDRFRATSPAAAERVAAAMEVLRDHCAVRTDTGF